MNFSSYILLVALTLSGCTPSEDPENPNSEKPMALIGKNEASELLLEAIDNYKARSFQELVSEIGIGDDYYMVSEGDDGSKEGYSISIENEWHGESQDQLILTATIFGPSPKEGGIVPEFHRESMVVDRY